MQKHGGVCFVGSKRYGKANHYMPDYRPDEEEHLLMYWDANNLYGWAMMQTLPYEDLKLNKDIFLSEILNATDDGPVGFRFALPYRAS